RFRVERFESQRRKLEQRRRLGHYIGRKERSSGWRHPDVDRFRRASGRGKTGPRRRAKAATEFQKTVKPIKNKTGERAARQSHPERPCFFVLGGSSGEPRRFAILARWPQSEKDYSL